MWRCIYFPIYFMVISEIASYVSLYVFLPPWPLELWLQCFGFSGPKNGSKNSSPEMHFLGQMVSSTFFWFQEIWSATTQATEFQEKWLGGISGSRTVFYFGVKILSFRRTTLVLLKLRSCSVIFENTSVGSSMLVILGIPKKISLAYVLMDNPATQLGWCHVISLV